MFGAQTARPTQHVAFLLLPNFSMLAFTSSVEPLRAANRESGRELYTWQTLSMDGAPVAASNGVVLKPACGLNEPWSADALFVCAGLGANQFNHAPTLATLRKLARGRLPLGGICSGALTLARAGVLDGYRCTIHWEYVELFAEQYPQLDITATLFEIDRDRYTCSGGTAPLDMMINTIAADHGDELAIKAAEQMLHTFVRHPHDTQRMPVKHRLGITSPKLLGAIAHMEAYLEQPLSQKDLASAMAVSQRQLERLFRENLDTTPSRYYLDLRLKRARLLLRETEMPIVQVAVATGFASASHFALRYRRYFKRAPREERRHIEPLPTAPTDDEQRPRQAGLRTLAAAGRNVIQGLSPGGSDSPSEPDP